MAPGVIFPNTTYPPRNVAGLEVFFEKDSRITFTLVLIKRNGSLFEIIQTFSAMEAFDELIGKVEKDSPVVVTISGAGILHKQMVDDPNRSLLNSFTKIFPHSNPNEFYIQKSNDEGNNTSYISVLRKDQLDRLLTKLHNIKVISVVFGPFAIIRLLPLIESTSFINDSILLGRYQLSFNNNHIENISWSEKVEASDKIKLSHEEYDSASLIPYASVMNYYAAGNLITEAEIESVISQKQDFQYEGKFRLAGISLAAIFFVILLANFFLFNNYFSKSNDLKQSLSINSRSIDQLDSLKKELDSHKQVLASYNFKGMSKTSYYADQIAASVPHSITLEELYLFPLKKSDAGSEDLLFDDKKILISGYSRASIELNEWIKQLQQNNWVGKVNILSYNQTGGKDKGKFSIEVELM